MHKSVLITVFVAAMVMFTQTSSAQNPDNAAFEAYSRGDYERALRLNEPGIAQKDGAALWLRGLMHATGAGVDRNHVLAIEYLSAGVDAGATYGLTLIGNIYQEGGYGVAQDIAKAAQVYKTAADEGYADAQWLLGEPKQRRCSAKLLCKNTLKLYSLWDFSIKLGAALKKIQPARPTCSTCLA
jgi:uncharacterized protein